MTIQEHGTGFFNSNVNPLRERLTLEDHRIIRSNGEVVYSLPEHERRRLLGRRVLQRRPPRDYGYDVINQSHDTVMSGARKVMRRRLHFEAAHGIDTPLPTELEHDVSSLYGQVGANLEDLYEQRKKDRRNRSAANPDHIKRVGNLSEAAFLALFTRTMTGEPSDTSIIIPSSPSVDQLGYDHEGYNMAYDFRVLKRGGEPVKLQTKTYERQLTHPERERDAINQYSPEILVVSLESVAGGAEGISRLHQAIIRDLDARATSADTEHIEESTGRLFQSIDNHLAKF